MVEKSTTLPTDVIMFDLEDAVPYTDEAKRVGRATVVSALERFQFGPREVIVRLNALGSPWFEADLEAVVAVRPHAVVPPKVTTAEDMAAVSAALDAAGAPPELRIWAGIETAGAVLRCEEIAAASPRIELLRFGFGDYTVTMHGQFADTNEHLLYPLSHVLAVARDRGLGATTTAVVFSDIRRLDLVRESALFARKLGYDGCTVIHPSHLDVVNEVFAPTPEEIQWALQQEDLLAAESGNAVAVVEGHLIEQVHLKLARRTLAIARELGLVGDA
jgi:citrate lyase subunit beta/citryl-CoA lyase